ncbi:unnamed protein product, partial [Prorocentrum cordatum]
MLPGPGLPLWGYRCGEPRAERGWVHGGNKPRRARFREPAEVVEVDDGEDDKLASGFALLASRGLTLDDDARKKLGLEAAASKAPAAEPPKSRHAAAQSAMWKVKNATAKPERAQKWLDAARELAQKALGATKAARDTASAAHEDAEVLLERARRAEQAGLPPEAAQQAHQRAADID